jgi:hypothetical protein
MAQNQPASFVVEGTVTDSSGTKLQGVSVLMYSNQQEPSQAVKTDAKGAYRKVLHFKGTFGIKFTHSAYGTADIGALLHQEHQEIHKVMYASSAISQATPQALSELNAIKVAAVQSSTTKVEDAVFREFVDDSNNNMTDERFAALDEAASKAPEGALRAALRADIMLVREVVASSR